MLLTKAGLGIYPERITPFTAAWPKNELPQGATRFRLPALMFEGQEVARLGFRATDGFMMVRRGLSDQVIRAAAQRFNAIVEMGKLNTKIYTEERAATLAPFYRAMHADSAHQAYGTRIALPLLDTLNVLKRVVPGPALGMEFKGDRAHLTMSNTQYPFTINVAECQQQGRDGTLFRFKETRVVSDRAALDAFMQRELAAITADMAEHPAIRALANMRVAQVPRGFTADKVMQQNDDRIEDPESGLVIRRAAKGSQQLLVEAEGVLLGRCRMQDTYLSEMNASSLIGGDRSAGRMSAAARNMMVLRYQPPEQVADNRAARKSETTSDDLQAWAETLDAAVRTTDFGYA